MNKHDKTNSPNSLIKNIDEMLIIGNIYGHSTGNHIQYLPKMKIKIILN